MNVQNLLCKSPLPPITTISPLVTSPHDSRAPKKVRFIFLPEKTIYPISTGLLTLSFDFLPGCLSILSLFAIDGPGSRISSTSDSPSKGARDQSFRDRLVEATEHLEREQLLNRRRIGQRQNASSPTSPSVASSTTLGNTNSTSGGITSATDPGVKPIVSRVGHCDVFFFTSILMSHPFRTFLLHVSFGNRPSGITPKPGANCFDPACLSFARTNCSHLPLKESFHNRY